MFSFVSIQTRRILIESYQLLVSKSNYERIIEGSTSDLDLSYPERLAGGLKAKRIYYKIAEKAQRDRIKKALEDLAGLLPPTRIVENASRMPVYPTLDDTEDRFSTSHCDSIASQICTDKINVIERAMEYIDNLQKELAETKFRLDRDQVSREGRKKRGREYTLVYS